MITITYHAEIADDGVYVWAESDQLPGFSAAANDLDAARALVREALAAEGVAGEEISEVLSDVCAHLASGATVGIDADR